MKVAHPMLNAAERAIMRSGDRRQASLLLNCLETIRSGELVLAGLSEAERTTFLSLDNKQEMVFLLAVSANRRRSHDPVHYWVEHEEFEDVPATLEHHLHERLRRYLNRRQSILPDQQLGDPEEFVIPEGVVHAAWIITRHPHDGLSTQLLIRRTISLAIGLTFLEDAILKEFFPPGKGRGR